MSPAFALSALLLLLTWLLLRRQAGAWRHWSLLPLDAGPILLGWLAMLSISRRPLLAAIVVVACGIGLLVVDVIKRATLREPLVFADRAELLEILRHPRFYLPFAGPLKVIAGAAAAVIVAALLLWLEPEASHPSPLLMLPVVLACALLPGRAPLLAPIAAFYRSRGVSFDPVTDMRRHGFLACLIVHATLAASERAGRRSAADARPPLPSPDTSSPVVLVQIESFFDARRLGPSIPPSILASFARMQREATAFGRLDVPCWGANTVRTEFLALTGIGAHALGLDVFNPYERFALARIRSIAWTMKQAGFRTICVHPFDKTFYGRNRVLPQLGFDAFYGPETFPGAAKAGGYVTDLALAEAVLRIVAAEGPAVFVFAISIGNHGPWDGPPTHPPAPAMPALPRQMAPSDRAALSAYLAGIQASDRMIARLTEALPSGAALCVYGDHQPSLPGAFTALGWADARTDYAIWRAGAPASPHAASAPARLDLRADELAENLLRGRATGIPRDLALSCPGVLP